ncbi:MAG: ABC transporter permease [Lachnospiraceae bacterium]|uniref:ABC transporter permease n=1 Tax=Candidatus Merdisoma sp. JLR.KK011 TaxID=3114299 RepID=UPI00155911BD|nr:ABC transporter permease [Lachnospiraceae bacterium]MCI9382686.1 ABC transporter permease [Lachnospiraceae bacterium]MCI9477477.1 ABC transporter permease [Lachnospiraceae bacterium]MCI9622602.1 ABC transporter permease [Lachnospiraceae bacterium]
MKQNEKKKNYLIDNGIVSFVRRNMGILIGLAVLFLFLSIFTNSFLTAKNMLQVLRQICINALLAFGMTFVLIIGGIDLTVGSVVAISGVSIVMLLNMGIPLPAAFLLALLIGSLVGLLNGSIIALTGMPPFIVTLSLQGAIRGVAYVITDGRSVSCENEVFNAIGNGYFLGIPLPIYIVAFVMLLISVILYYTRFGRRMYAVGGNVTAAQFSGIHVKQITIWVYVISGTLSALAGIILASRMYSGQPASGQAYESDAIAAAVLGGTSFNGGIGTIGGTLIGALVIGFLTNGLNLLHISSYVQMIIKGVVIIGAVGIDILKNRNKGN